MNTLFVAVRLFRDGKYTSHQRWNVWGHKEVVMYRTGPCRTGSYRTGTNRQGSMILVPYRTTPQIRTPPQPNLSCCPSSIFSTYSIHIFSSLHIPEQLYVFPTPATCLSHLSYMYIPPQPHVYPTSAICIFHLNYVHIPSQVCVSAKCISDFSSMYIPHQYSIVYIYVNPTSANCTVYPTPAICAVQYIPPQLYVYPTSAICIFDLKLYVHSPQLSAQCIPTQLHVYLTSLYVYTYQFAYMFTYLSYMYIPL
jgi:hypothetical protein